MSEKYTDIELDRIFKDIQLSLENSFKRDTKVLLNEERLEKLEKEFGIWKTEEYIEQENLKKIKELEAHKEKHIQLIMELEEKEDLHYHCFREMSKWLLKIGRQQKKLEQKFEVLDTIRHDQRVEELKRMDTLSAVLRSLICDWVSSDIDVSNLIGQLDGTPKGATEGELIAEFLSKLNSLRDHIITVADPFSSKGMVVVHWSWIHSLIKEYEGRRKE